MSQPEECEGAHDVVRKRGAWRGHAVTGGALWCLCAAWYLLPVSAESVEYVYSRGAYRTIVAVVTTVTGAVPFSIMLLLIVMGPLLFLGMWTGNWAYRRKALRLSHWRGLLWGPKWMFVLIPALWLWFLLFWGMGYQRLPIETRLGFDDEKVTEEELLRIEAGLLAVIERDQPADASDRDVPRAVAAVARAMSAVVEAWEARPMRIPSRVKATPPGLLLMNGTSGVCVPFTLEPHVDGGLPDTAFVAVAAHELGHIAGVCDEGETNLIGYIAGLRADDPYARYAVALGVYRHVAGQRGPEAYRQAVERLPEQAREDMRLAREASIRYRIEWFQKWSWRAYNHYLKSQGVREGVASYGRGAQLLARVWRAGHLELPEGETY